MARRRRAYPMKSSFKGRVILPKKSSDNWYSRGYFPHFDGAGVTQHVCFHLFDSLPESLLAQWREELQRRETSKVRLAEIDAQREWRRRLHDALDRGYGACSCVMSVWQKWLRMRSYISKVTGIRSTPGV